MNRYGKDHKATTRRAIVEASGRRFKLDGIDGSGVATLMKDAGLTNGAVYAHFGSKDELVAATIADQLASHQHAAHRGHRPCRRGRVRQVVPVTGAAH